jgi:hypothetical protein
MTVSYMLLYQNTADPAVDAGKVWYGLALVRGRWIKLDRKHLKK